MMNQQEFDDWSKKLNLTEEAKSEIQLIRNAPPRRLEFGKDIQIIGKFASEKMGVIIEFESHKFDLPGLRILESNENVLEFYYRPPSIKVSYCKSNSRNKRIDYDYAPYFFVIEKDRAYWADWKTEEQLLRLYQEKSGRYLMVNSRWLFIPGRDYAQKHNFDYLVYSLDEIKLS